MEYFSEYYSECYSLSAIHLYILLCSPVCSLSRENRFKIVKLAVGLLEGF